MRSNTNQWRTRKRTAILFIQLRLPEGGGSSVWPDHGSGNEAQNNSPGEHERKGKDDIGESTG
ncbi:hypothetical protein, partial [Mesorhizobium sp. B1-1-5]|uniref:hypothetical protein n=1 Tax=Mesorhizobium sp. B1-1-5 TaxID=2589979 RepID=UPI001AED810F